MLHPSTQKLIDRLAAMTAQKKIDWIEKDNGEVIYATEGYIVRLTPEPPRVLLTTENGKSLEDATTSLLTSAMHADGGTYGDLVASIARSACREARGTEEAISTLLAGLSDDDAAVEAEPEAEADAEPEEIAADEQEEPSPDELVVAAAGPTEDLIEDAGDETSVLDMDEPETAEAQPSDAEGTPANPWSRSEEFADVSVPEAALIADEEAMDDDQDDEDVSGAVARLADEVNGVEAAKAEASEAQASEPESSGEIHGIDDFPELPDDIEAQSHEFSDTETADTEPAGFDAAEEDETADEADTPLSSFSVMPDEGQTFDLENDPEEVDTLAVSDLAEEETIDLEETEGVDAVMTEAAEPVSEAEEIGYLETVTEADAPADDTNTWNPVTPESASSDDNVVRYVPFGAGYAAQTADVPPEVSDAEPEPVDEDSFAPAMDATPVTDQGMSDLEVEEISEEDETLLSTPQEDVHAATDEAEAEQTAPEIETVTSTGSTLAPVPQPVTSLSLSGFSAGLGFGATQSGFTPTPPRPADTAATESVSRASVVIDATDDFPNDYSGAAEADLPSVEDLNLPVDASEDDSLLDAPAPSSDIEAVAPEPASPPAVPETEASEVVEEVEEFPARPKTRFNPWT